MSDVTIYHSATSRTSRNVLALIRHAGIEPRVVDYVKTPPSKEALQQLLSDMGVSIRALLREKGTPVSEFGLVYDQLTDEQLVDFIAQYPIFMNRPVVVSPLGAKLCRPLDVVLELLPVRKVPPFTTEDGEVINDSGKRRSLA